jgi:hypothetical protein
LKIQSCNSFNQPFTTGSIQFNPSVISYVTVQNSQTDPDFILGTSNFTIEWWQYQTDNNESPRIFSIGTHPSASLAFECGNNSSALFWANSLNYNFGLTNAQINK